MQKLKGAAYLLLLMGTLGLLLNEFLLDIGRWGTVISASLSLAGFFLLALPVIQGR